MQRMFCGYFSSLVANCSLFLFLWQSNVFVGPNGSSSVYACEVGRKLGRVHIKIALMSIDVCMLVRVVSHALIDLWWGHCICQYFSSVNTFLRTIGNCKAVIPSLKVQGWWAEYVTPSHALLNFLTSAWYCHAYLDFGFVSRAVHWLCLTL